MDTAITSANTQNVISAKEFLIEANLEKYAKILEGFSLQRICIMPISDMRNLGLQPCDAIQLQKHRKKYQYLKNQKNWVPTDLPDLTDLFQEKLSYCVKSLKDLGISNSLTFLLSYDTIKHSELRFNPHVLGAFKKLYTLWVDKEKAYVKEDDSLSRSTNNSEQANNNHSSSRTSETIETEMKMILESELKKAHRTDELLQGRSRDLVTDPLLASPLLSTYNTDAPRIVAEEFLKRCGISTENITLELGNENGDFSWKSTEKSEFFSTEVESPHRNLLNMNQKELCRTVLYLLKLLEKNPEIKAKYKYTENKLEFGTLKTAMKPPIGLKIKANVSEDSQVWDTVSCPNNKMEARETILPAKAKLGPLPSRNAAIFPNTSQEKPDVRILPTSAEAENNLEFKTDGTAIEPLIKLTGKANVAEVVVAKCTTRSTTNKIETKQAMEPSRKKLPSFSSKNSSSLPDSPQKNPDDRKLPTYAEIVRKTFPSLKTLNHTEDRNSRISSYDDSKTLNILLLGVTGVGKSTVINAFLNYMSYNSLDIAKNQQLIAPIPASFSVTDDNFEDHVVRVGIEKEGFQNEAFNEVGHSSTQMCRSYVIETKEYGRIRIIDTPGLGDTRGAEKDKENIQNILSYISQFTHLNGICILLKPNDSRLTPSFHLVLTTLLMNLDATATKNIIFLFTNARSTFYEPGDTKGILETVLQKIYLQPPYVKVNFDQSNTFCIDNESFRYLAAKKCGLDFLDAESASIEMSWERSVEQYDKLLRYVQNLTPYLLTGKKSLCEARRMLTTLAEPAALIILEAIITIGAIGRNIQEIQSSTATQTGDIERLKQKLFTDVSETIYRAYFPRVVCCKSCNDRIEIVDGFMVHPKICFQFGVSYYGDEFRLHIRKDENGFCLNCGCHPTCHDFPKQVPIQIIRCVQDSNIFDKLSNYESLMKYSQDQEHVMRAQNREIQLLVEALSSLTAYIERNSIFCPIDILSYKLNAILKQEEAKATLGHTNQHIIRDLEYYIKMYNNSKLEGLRDPKLDLTSTFNFVEIIYHGEFYGKKLRELVQNIELVEQAARKFSDEIISLSSTELETAL